MWRLRNFSKLSGAPLSSVVNRGSELWPNAVEEVLRYEPPIQLVGRHTPVDVPLGDTAIPAGSEVTAPAA